MPKTNAVSNTSAATEFLVVGSQKYAYRRFGSGSHPPLLCLQHFTGTLDNWDPAVTDALAQRGDVILFESAGIGRSTGTVPETGAGTAKHALAFLDGLGLQACDVLGFSLGGMVAQQMALDRPSIFRKLILVGTIPRGGEEDVSHLRVSKQNQSNLFYSEALYLYLQVLQQCWTGTEWSENRSCNTSKTTLNIPLLLCPGFLHGFLPAGSCAMRQC